MNFGFTGTREGMTGRQWRALHDYLCSTEVTEAHHGDCVGSDAQFHGLVRLLHPTACIKIHPPLNPRHRAFCLGDLRFPRRDYLDRNKDIVDLSEYLIATPHELTERQRSGTWSTIRYARKQGRGILIVFPTGKLSIEPRA